MSDVVLGLDFGTSTCQLAVCAPDGIVRRPLPIGRDGSSTFMPSSAFVDNAGELYIGEDADDAARSGRPGILLPSAKRYNRPWRAALGRRLAPWPVENPTPYGVVSSLIAEVLQRACRVLVDRGAVESEASFFSSELHLSCMVDSDLEMRRALVNACRDAGATDVAIDRVTEEAICAGIFFGGELGTQSGEFLVYDYGGGSFDTAYIRTALDAQGGADLSILACGGVSHLGGDDIDQAMYDLLVIKLASALEFTDDGVRSYLRESPITDRLLRQYARDVKERLSADGAVALSASQLLLAETPGSTVDDIRIEITRAELEDLMCDDVDESINTVVGTVMREVQTTTGRNANEVRNAMTGIYLSGGMSQIPFVRERVERYFLGIQVRSPKLVGPQDCVAVGASRASGFTSSNRKHSSYAISLSLDTGEPLSLYDHFEQTFSWTLAYGLYQGTKTIPVPTGANVAKVRFLDANGQATEVSEPISLPEREVTVSFRRGALVIGTSVVHELPWLTEDEQARSRQLWEEETRRQAEQADQRRLEMHRTLPRNPMLEN